MSIMKKRLLGSERSQLYLISSRDRKCKIRTLRMSMWWDAKKKSKEWKKPCPILFEHRLLWDFSQSYGENVKTYRFGMWFFRVHSHPLPKTPLGYTNTLWKKGLCSGIQLIPFFHTWKKRHELSHFSRSAIQCF
jgi:hypothetical protein